VLREHLGIDLFDLGFDSVDLLIGSLALQQSDHGDGDTDPVLDVEPRWKASHHICDPFKVRRLLLFKGIRDFFHSGALLSCPLQDAHERGERLNRLGGGRHNPDRVGRS